MSRTELEADNFRLKALLAEVNTAFITAGWVDCDLTRRVRAAMAKPAEKPKTGELSSVLFTIGTEAARQTKEPS